MYSICTCTITTDLRSTEKFVENYTVSILTNKNHSGKLGISKDKTLNFQERSVSQMKNNIGINKSYMITATTADTVARAWDISAYDVKHRGYYLETNGEAPVKRSVR